MSTPQIKAPGGRTAHILAQIPQHLKDHDNFGKIYSAIAEAGASKHSHGEVSLWATCDYCQRKANDRLLMMKTLGFTSKAMYLTWLRIHKEIDSNKREPLRKYNSA